MTGSCIHIQSHPHLSQGELEARELVVERPEGET